MGRAPTVTFKPDDSRIRLNHISHLIEVSDKPPEDEVAEAEKESSATSSKLSLSRQDDDEIGVDLSKRISAFSFPPDAPTWAEMKRGVILVRDSRNLNHDHLMKQSVKAKVSANPALAQQWDESMQKDLEASQMKYSWRFDARDKDELTTYLRERKQKISGRKLRNSVGGLGSNDGDEDYDDYRDNDDDDDDDIDVNDGVNL